MNCSLNKNHLVCSKPVEVKCHKDQTYLACHECVLKEADYSGAFKCKLCTNDHSINFLEAKKISSLTKLELQSTLRSLITRGNSINSSLKDKLNGKYRQNLLISMAESVKQDFLIRIEILKYELDNLVAKLDEKIDTYKFGELGKSQQTREILKSLLFGDKNISDHIFTNQKCKLYEQNLKFLSQFVNIYPVKLKLTDKNRVCAHQTQIRSLIGFLQGPFSNLTIGKELNLVPTIHIVDLSCFIKSSCGLAEIFDGKKFCLAMTDFAANDIKIMSKYDSYGLTEIDIVSRENFRLNKFKCYYAICSSDSLVRGENENLYACDMELHRVIVFDQNVTKMRRIISQLPGGEEFECPRDICYHDGFFYVLDQGKNVINIFYKSGDFFKNFYFDKLENVVKNPWSVRVGRNRIVLIDWKEKVFVFDFEFNLLDMVRIESVLSMCLIDGHEDEEFSVFFHCENGRLCGYKINCFEAKFDLIFDQSFKMLKYRSEFMIFTSSQHFILSLGWNKSLAIIDFA